MYNTPCLRTYQRTSRSAQSLITVLSNLVCLAVRKRPIVAASSRGQLGPLHQVRAAARSCLIKNVRNACISQLIVYQRDRALGYVHTQTRVTQLQRHRQTPTGGP